MSEKRREKRENNSTARRLSGFRIVHHALTGGPFETGSAPSVIDVSDDYPRVVVMQEAPAVFDTFKGKPGEQVNLNDLLSVRTVYPGGEERLSLHNESSRCGKCSVAAAFIVACGRKRLKSGLFQAKRKGR